MLQLINNNLIINYLSDLLVNELIKINVSCLINTLK